MNGRPYTTSEIKNIFDLHFNQKESVKDIAIATDRTEKAIYSVIKRYKDLMPDKDYKQGIVTTKSNEELIAKLIDRDNENIINNDMKQEEPKPAQLTPREMIKHLYSLGYRIKNNELVVLVEQKVNIKDIING